MDSDSEILKEVFGGQAGEKALNILRNLAKVDNICRLKSSEREQCYALGRASLYEDLLKIIKSKKHGRKQQPRLSEQL